MSTVTSIFSRMSPDRKTPAQVVSDALPGMDDERVTKAQSRASRLIGFGVEDKEAISRAISWARCAIDPSDPTPPKVA